MMRRMKLSYINPMSLAKFFSVLTSIGAFLVLFFVLIVTFFGELINNSGVGAVAGALGKTALTLVIGLIVVTLSVIMSFVEGYLIALIYNKFLSKIIGLEFEFNELR